MLLYAIQDEYSVQDEYSSIIKAFNVNRPFSNIIKVERTHIGCLETLFEKYNIAMYDIFLKQELPADIKVIFEALK